MLCAIIFVMTSSAHAMHHFEGFDGKSNVEISVINDAGHSGDLDSEGKSAGADQHDCCGCVSIALINSVQTFAGNVGFTFFLSNVGTLEPRSPTIDTPYPIVTI